MKKEVIINMVAQIFMFVVNLGISFFLVPYITKIIGVEAYGFVGLANDFVGYAQIITIAINSMASRFITIKIYEKKIEEANKYYSSVIIVNFVLSMILAVVGTIFVLFMHNWIDIPSHLITDVKLLFIFIFMNFITSILTSTFAVSTFCTNKLYLSSIKTILSQIIKVIILFVTFILLKPSVFYIGLASLISTAYLGYCNYKYSKSLTPELVISKKYFNISYIKTLLASGIWNTFSKISNILSSGLNLLLTNIFVGSAAMGIIGISKTLPNTILNAFATISSVFSPELTINYAKKDFENMKKQLLFSVKLLSIFAAIPITLLFAFGKEFYALWMPTQNTNLIYYLSCIAVLDIILALPLEPLWNIFTVTNKVKQSSLFLFANSLLTVILVIILMLVFPNSITRMVIVLSVTAAFSIVRNLTFLPLYGAKCLNLKKSTFYPSIIRNVIIILISTILSFLLKKVYNISNWINLIFISIVSIITILIISYSIVLNKEERKFIKDKINNFKKTK